MGIVYGSVDAGSATQCEARGADASAGAFSTDGLAILDWRAGLVTKNMDGLEVSGTKCKKGYVLRYLDTHW
jgi:hypothetical protein